MIAWLYTEDEAQTVAKEEGAARLDWPSGQQYILSTHMQVVHTDCLSRAAPIDLQTDKILYDHTMCLVKFDTQRQGCDFARCFQLARTADWLTDAAMGPSTERRSSMVEPLEPSIDAPKKHTRAAAELVEARTNLKANRSVPRGLITHGGNLSHSNAVLQALATAVDAAWLRTELGYDMVGPQLSFEAGSTATEMEDKIVTALRSTDATTRNSINPIAELLHVLEGLQSNSTPVNPYAWQYMTTGLVPECTPLRWLASNLHLLSVGYPGFHNAGEDKLSEHPLIARLFRTKESVKILCRGPKCRGKQDARWEEREEWGYAIQHPLHGVGSSTDTEKPITEMVKSAARTTATSHDCTRCKGPVEAERTGGGFKALPEILVLALNEGDMQGGDDEHDACVDDQDGAADTLAARPTHLEPLLHLDEYGTRRYPSSTQFRLQTVIKRAYHADGKPVYSASTRVADGTWWDCHEETVSETTVEDARSLLGGRKPCLLFYEKLHAEDKASKRANPRRR